MIEIIPNADGSGYIAMRIKPGETAQGQLFENPKQLAAAGYSIADFSAMINSITGKNTRQPSVARGAKQLFKLLESDK